MQMNFLLGMVKGRRSKRRRCPAANLTDDLIVEVLSRLPARSVCRFKCVSTTWRDLISHPVNRMKLPQTLAGFFTKHDGETVPWSVPCFTNVSGRGVPLPLVSPSLDFLPVHKRIFLLDNCNGLLLCGCYGTQFSTGEWDLTDYHHFVCNPATKEWVALPGRWQCSRLGFNPTVSPHFYVFEFFRDYGHLAPLVIGEVYSSETGGWVRKENEVDNDFSFPHRLPAVFFNGCMHYLTNKASIAVVDTGGNARRNIPVPVPGEQWFGFIQLSQGRLHYANFEADHEDEVVRLVVYVLEDYDRKRWTLKHTAEAPYILGWPSGLYEPGWNNSINLADEFEWVAVHPDCNMIFYTLESDKILMSYDMDRRQVQEIFTLGADTRETYLPYVPLFSELQALHIRHQYVIGSIITNGS
ncbi:hypothetical protein VPH35_007044 [Triticum aestivum]|uniref:F-box domain-containing protein n=2 Tax=Triticum aestivum TaxID=4565 RepID=A0A3B5YTP3_WHEAT